MKALITGAGNSLWGSRMLAAMLAGVAGVAGVAGAGLVAPARAEDQGANALEEVVVTARKQEEFLQRVPVSVVAITADELQKKSLETLASVGQVTPNFTFSQTGNGGNSSGLVYIRGVGQYDNLSTFDPAVGIYIDGVYLARMQNNDLDMMGIERLEILRGPQGTLFGKNTNGGAINIVTKEPNAAADGLQGRLQLTGGSLNRHDVLAGINIPIVTDKAAVEMSIARRSQDGYGQYADGEEMANRDRYAARLALLLKPIGTLSVVLRFDGTTYHEANASEKLVAVNAAGGLLSAFNAYQASHGGLIYDSRWVSPNDFTYNGTGANFSNGNLWGTSLTLDWDNPWGTLKSISSYRSERMQSGLDADGSPITELDYYANIHQHQISQEFQQSGASLNERLKWVGGVYFFGESARDEQGTDLATLNAAFTAIFAAPFSANFCQCLAISNQSYAAYAQGTYSLTDKLHLTLGARYTDDHKRVDRNRLTFSPVTGPGQPTQLFASQSAKFSAASPRLGFDYQWTPDLMSYISVSQGFKSGGFNGRSGSVAEFNEFSPEKVWAYEVGLRSDWLDRRLRLNATAFYSNYTDLQVATSFSKVVNGVPVPLTIVENIPKSRITGGELELTAIPVGGLRLIGGLGITRARYIEVNPTSQVATGMHFPNTPHLTYNLGAEYKTSLTANYGITGRIDYTHKSEIDTDLLNSPLIRQPAYGLLDARLILDTGIKGLSFSAFGTNLTDVHYFTGGASNYDTALGWAFVDMAPPREWGVSGEYRF